MKQKFLLITLGLLTVFGGCTAPSDSDQKEIIIREIDIVKRNLGVDGMTCVGCEVTLEEQVSLIEGVVSVKATYSDNKVTIEFDSTKTDILSIKQAIKEAGYKTF